MHTTDPSSSGTSDDTGVLPDRPSTTGTPRWVYAFGVIALVLVLLFVIVMLTGGGGHGPGRHTPSGDVGGHTPPAGVSTRGVPQP